MTLVVQGHAFAYEMECILRLFLPGSKIPVREQADPFLEDCAVTRLLSGEHGYTLFVSLRTHGYCGELEEALRADEPEAEQERKMAVLLFRLLCEWTGGRPRWGILTGIRPVRFCRAMREAGKSEGEIFETLTGDWLVSPEKARLALETGRVEQTILQNNSPRACSLYIGIPFCPSRCLYCSFVSHEIEKTFRLVPAYVERLCDEIRRIGEIVGEQGLFLQTVYMGGGTPTSLDAEQLARILHTVEMSFSFDHLLEYTVEAGRPDTITAEKLKAMKAHGVGRISINPQTMNDAVLEAIGRKHTAKQTLDSFALARAEGFDRINMDLIAGLPGDTPTKFRDSLDKVLSLSPENITVHTLTVKRSSGLREKQNAWEPGDSAAVMLDYAYERLRGDGYRPCYLYRQKGTRQNLENTGFSKPGHEGVYNIYSMEENHTIFAAGAGGVTKLCANGKVERVFNYKYPYEYLDRFDEILRRKGLAGAFYEGNRREKIFEAGH